MHERLAEGRCVRVEKPETEPTSSKLLASLMLCLLCHHATHYHMYQLETVLTYLATDDSAPIRTVLVACAFFHCSMYTELNKMPRKVTSPSGYAMVVHGRPKTPKNTSFFEVTQPPGVTEPLYSRGHN